ncbi:MAG: flagellar type III secretion system pore protein FliP [Planctomycetota bacterium]|nr:flagellar type III secretion system pore protein FliP [Planctomycetota bacterium]
MMSRTIRLLAILCMAVATLLAASGTARAEALGSPSATSPRGPIVPPSLEPRPAPSSNMSNGQAAPKGALPDIADVLAVVDKATAGDSETGGKPSDYSAPVKLAVVFTGLALLPAALMMMTSFTRIVIVLSFIRRALTTQNIPPTVAIIGLALFLTFFTMAPTFTKINVDAVQPYLAGQIAFPAACNKGIDELKEFMVRQTRQSDLAYFVELAKVPTPQTAADIPAHVAIPAFAISEFRISFEMGCLLFIPFLLIDLVVAGILLSAGMMMLPPSIISLPFKIILFVLVDGWHLLAQSLVTSFN